MSNFNEYTRLSQEIHAPEKLKNQVLVKAARQSKKQKKGHYLRPMSIMKKVGIAAAILAVALPVTAFGVSRTMGLREHLEQSNRDPQLGEAVESLMVTVPSSAKDAESVPCIASAKDDMAEYRLLEAACDSKSLYLHMQVVPLKDDVMFIDQCVSPDGSVGDMCIPGVSEGTPAEYAKSQGKQLCYASLTPEFNGEIINGWGVWAETAPDGSLHVYGEGNNPSGEKEYTMGFSGFTYALDNQEIVPLEARTTFEATIQDISSSEKTVYKHFRAYDPKSPDLEKDLGVVLDSLTMEKTELGYYATFTYHLTKDTMAKVEEEARQPENSQYSESDMLIQHLVGFIVLDENGEFFQVNGPDGGCQGAVDNGDGTFSYTDSLPNVESINNLKFKVLTPDLDKVGLYAYDR